MQMRDFLHTSGVSRIVKSLFLLARFLLVMFIAGREFLRGHPLFFLHADHRNRFSI